MSKAHKVVTVAATAASVFVLSACGNTVAGTPVAATNATPTSRAVATQSSAPDYRPTPTTTAQPAPTTNTPVVVTSTQEEVNYFIGDLNTFWLEYNIHAGATAKEQSKPLSCPGEQSADDNTANCHGTVLYDAAGLDAQAHGDKYVVGLEIAHEVGHTVEHQLGKHDRSVYAHEIAADCYAGMYIAAKQQPLDETSASFKKTEMYGYGHDAALQAFQRGYHNYNSDALTIANAKQCLA